LCNNIRKLFLSLGTPGNAFTTCIKMNFAHWSELLLGLLHIYHTLKACVCWKRGQKYIVLNHVPYRLVEPALGVVKLRRLLLVVINPDCNCHVVHFDF